MRRFALTLCVLILGAGFTPALPSTVDPPRPASVVLGASRAAPEPSTVDEPLAAPGQTAAPAAPVAAAGPLPAGRHVGAVAGRAPPARLA